MIALLEMPLTRRLVPLVMALLVALTAVEMIRRRKLREEYAMLWVLASAVLLVIAIFPDLVIWLEEQLKVHYLTIVVLALFGFLAMILMHYATVISRHAEHIRQLAEQVALLEHQLRKHRRQPGDEEA